MKPYVFRSAAAGYWAIVFDGANGRELQRRRDWREAIDLAIEIARHQRREPCS